MRGGGVGTVGHDETLSARYEVFLNERSVLEVVGWFAVVRVLAGWASFRHTFPLPALS